MKLNIQLFASGTITGSSTASVGRIQVLWTATAGDSVANSSEVTATVQVKRSNAYNTTGTFSGTVTINGDSKSISKKFSPISNSWKTVGTYTVTVPHNSDGTKTCNIQTRLTQSGTEMAGTYTANADVTLDTILRESTPTLSSSSVNMGSSVTIYTNRKSDSFTHTIRYAFGNVSGTIATGVGASTSWTPALTLAQQIPSATSGNGTIYCDTYSGGTLIGTKSVGITLNVPSSVVPTISIGTISEANATMISFNWGVYVQNKSQLSIPISVAGSQGSSISATTTTVNGVSYSGTSITTNIITSSGTITISSTTTDSRGRTATTSKTVSVVAYSNPQITNAVAVRSNSSGTESDEGTYLKYSFAGSVSTVSNHNGHLFRIGYRQKGIGSYSYTNINTTDYSINLSNGLLNLNLDTSKTYDIIFEANDSFTSTSMLRTIDTGFDLMNFNPSGKAMAIGKVSEATGNQELLEVGMNTEIDGNLNIKATYPKLSMNNQEALYISDGLYVGGQGNYMVFRPKGVWDTTGQMVLYPDGRVLIANNTDISGSIKSKNTCCYWTNQSITWSTTWSWQKMIWAGVSYNNTGIVLSSNQFYIPANVSIVKVSISCSFYNLDVPGDKNFAVFKNGSYANQLLYSNYQAANGYVNVSGFSYVSVAQNDYLSIHINSGQTGTMRIFEGTKVLIEIVA